MSEIIARIVIIALNWAFKLFVAFIMYSFVTWLGAPMWAVIAATAVAAVESKLKFEGLT